jgi:hypothetical protein
VLGTHGSVSQIYYVVFAAQYCSIAVLSIYIRLWDPVDSPSSRMMMDPFSFTVSASIFRDGYGTNNICTDRLLHLFWKLREFRLKFSGNQPLMLLSAGSQSVGFLVRMACCCLNSNCTYILLSSLPQLAYGCFVHNSRPIRGNVRNIEVVYKERALFEILFVNPKLFST